MKKILHGILATALFAGSVSAKTFTDKTFMMPRSHNPNLAMEYTSWHKQIRLHDEEKFGGSLQASLFYDESDNKADLGKYFGMINKQKNHQIDDYIMVDDHDATQLYTNDIIHFAPYDLRLYDSDVTNLIGAVDYGNLIQKIRFRPNRTSFGIRLDYHQKLDMLLDGLFLKIDAPIVHVKTSMNYHNIGEVSTQKIVASGSVVTRTGDCGIITGGSLYIDPDSTTGAEKNLEDYLTGDLVNTYSEAKQVALTHYKIHNGQSETGIADINVMLGYNFLYEADKHANVNLSLLIPTGNTPDGVYRFEPVVGNGNHWALGAGIDTAFELWRENDKSLDLSIVLNYKYLFKGTEKRTLNFKYSDTTDYTYYGQRVIWGPYVLGAGRGDTEAAPLANFVTQDVNVTPGNQVNGIVNLAFNWGNWTIDLGYELYAQEEEKVSLKGTWSDDTYGIAAQSWNTTRAFITGNATGGTLGEYDTIFRGGYSHVAWDDLGSLNEYTIDAEHFLTADAETPQQITHKIYGGVGYRFAQWNYPLLLGLGGSYELISGNAGLEGWSLWLKAGVAF
jgi:hypothetical protein